jgi:uncharacterized membrane protein
MSPFYAGKRLLQTPHLLIGLDLSQSIAKKTALQTLKNYEPVFRNWEQKVFEYPVSYFFMNENAYTMTEFATLMKRVNIKAYQKSALYQSVEKMKSQLNPGEYPVFLLLTDGNETEVNPSFLNQWAHSKTFVHFLPVNRDDSFYLQNIRLPASAFIDNEYRLEVIAHSSENGEAEIIIRRNGEEVLREPRKLRSGINYFDWLFHSEEPGLHSYEVEIKPDFPDANLTNNRQQTQIKLLLQETMLVIDKRPEHESAPFYRMLKDNGFKYHLVENPRSRDFLPRLESYAAVIVNNMSREELPAEFGTHIKEYIGNGGGFGFLGGEQSFGPGGWHRTELEEILPVQTPPRSYRQNTAIVFIIDVSGSMLCEDSTIYTNQVLLSQFLRNARPDEMPINAAKNAIIKMLSELNGVDSAVVEFNHTAKLTTPLQTVNKTNLPDMIKSVSDIKAGGGTNFYPPLTGAVSILSNYSYNEIHFVFLSDGLPSDKALMPGVLQQLKTANIRLHALAFGSGADAGLLKFMAGETGGGFFLSQNMEELSSSFSAAIDRVFGPPVVLAEKQTMLAPGQTLINNSETNLPSLLGYIQTTIKERADPIVISETGEPVFAIWRYGLGQSFVWTSDCNGRWSQNWVSSPWWSRVFATALNTVSKKDFDPFDLKIHIHGNQAYFLLTAVNESGEFMENLNIQAEVIPEKGLDNIPVFFRADSEDEYRASLSLNNPGSYELRLNIKQASEQKIKDEFSGNAILQKKAGFQIPLGIENSFATTNKKLQAYFDRQNPKHIIRTEKDLERVQKALEPRQQIETTNLAVIMYAMAIFLLCLDVIFRRFRVFEQLEAESQSSQPASEIKWLKLGEHYWNLARKALKEKEMKNAEGYYLSAHKYFKKAGEKDKTNAVWQEYRIKIR